MFLTKKHLPRRTFLKGAGVSLGLPILDAMIPAATALGQTAAARKLRVGFFYLPHGAVMGNTRLGPEWDRWTPSGTGSEFKLNAITQPLEPYKKYVTSIGNLKNDAVAASGSHGAAPGGTALVSDRPIHTIQPATWLSGTAPNLSSSTPYMSPTLDQVIARRIGQDSRIPSLQVASETTVQQRSGNGGAYTVLSFRDATTPLPMEFNPRKIFIQLFGDGNLAARRQVAEENASLLDLINEQTRALQRSLDPADRAALDDHLTAVRTAEQRIEDSNRFRQDIERAGGTALPPMPVGVMDDFDDQVNLIFDLIALAYRMDQTRVVSFMMASEGTNQTYNHIGVPESFHPISHHANDPNRMAGLVKIQTWHMERFAQFLGKLAAMPDGEGTLLDNSMFLYGSNMSNSDSHTNHPLPTLLVGGARGRLVGGRHIALPEATPIANLHLSILGLAGIEERRFGDSTGTIAL